ncbi:class I SAM-dependent methyltransferase [Nocardiopsis aegyptia]|uniref:class I SAM-dependent methyltransferase n=1 Tax=Nocardiopsis aegyptia TaxID=220378 RepID=UPI00366AF142
MDDTERVRGRATFTEDAELYDRARPGYPPRMFDDLAELTGAGPGSRVLEIGCGTGQATGPMAERGYRIVAVELGADMARVARRRLARFAHVEVVRAAFEDWRPPAEPFDLVASATAFHWIDPAVRLAKSAAVLRTGGALATVATHHVYGGSTAFFAEVQECYERFDPSTPPDVRLRPAAEVPFDDPEPDAAGLFDAPVFRRYERDLEYTTGEYLDVLRTYSGHRALGPRVRERMLDRIGGLIDRRHGGRVVKRYLTELRVARLRDTADAR